MRTNLLHNGAADLADETEAWAEAVADADAEGRRESGLWWDSRLRAAGSLWWWSLPVLERLWLGLGVEQHSWTLKLLPKDTWRLVGLLQWRLRRLLEWRSWSGLYWVRVGVRMRLSHCGLEVSGLRVQVPLLGRRLCIVGI